MILLAPVFQEAPPLSLKAQHVIGSYLWQVPLLLQQVLPGSVIGCHRVLMSHDRKAFCPLAPTLIPSLSWLVVD